MMLIVTENAPPRLRGRLSLLLLEVRAGVYAGAASVRVREELWEMTQDNIGEGDAVMVWPDSDNATGINFVATGKNRRVPHEVDGLRFVGFQPAVDAVAAVGEIQDGAETLDNQ